MDFSLKEYEDDFQTSLTNRLSKILHKDWGNKNFIIEPQARIAQMVICSVVKANLIQTNILSDTERGSGGFGSTGDNNE